MEAICRYYGSLVGVRYGEPFLTRELMQVDEVVEFPAAPCKVCEVESFA
ncbi:MAG: hypothetical protein ACRD35_08495 [Candidatus Acidiferrales bacterium]